MSTGRPYSSKEWQSLFLLTCEDCRARPVAHVVRWGESVGRQDPASDEDVCICQICYERMREG